MLARDGNQVARGEVGEAEASRYVFDLMLSFSSFTRFKFYSLTLLLNTYICQHLVFSGNHYLRLVWTSCT